MRFDVLGPIGVGGGGEQVVLPAGIPRTILAVLLLNANQAVSRDRLVASVWGEDPPSKAVASLHNHVSRLRRRLGTSAAARIRTEAPGYLVEVHEGELDRQLFVDGCQQGRQALQAGDWAKASEVLASALALWRGEPFRDIPADADAYAQVQQLRETRFLALEGWIEAGLNLGRHQELIAEIRALVDAHPLREELHRQLMLALYRAGRQAEALDVFQVLRRTLVEELAVEPSSVVQELHRRILSADPELTAPALVPVYPASMPEAPAAGSVEAAAAATRAGRNGTRFQLPADTRAFTGRTRELNQLLALAREGTAGGAAGRVVISAIDGMAGTGKSTLAIHAAHLLRERFPDGQLFIDLHGHTPGAAALTADDALDQLLRSLGVPPALIPKDVSERAAFYRDRLVGTRVVIVLDNAASTAQVRPLLPATGCMVIVTSRKRLTGLDDAHTLALDTLPDADATALLHAVAGSGRIPADGPALGELVALCGRIPLALRITAARLRHHRALRIEDIVGQLRDEHSRLDYLQDDDRSLAAVFESSYTALPTAEQRLFRYLGLVPGDDIDAHGAAGLTGTDHRSTERLLESLLDHNMLAQHTSGRYRLHDLVRLYARTLADRDPAEERDAALGRLLDYYQHTARTADRRIARHTRPSPPAVATPVTSPALPDLTAALAWMRAERENLLAGITHCTARQQPSRVIALTSALASFLHQEGLWGLAAALHHTAATTAHELGDRTGEANALCDLGLVRLATGDLPAMADLFSRALAAYQDLGSHLGRANAVWNLGRARLLTGEYVASAALLEQALAVYRDVGDRQGEANVLHTLAHVRLMTGAYPAAAGLHERALAIYRDLGNRQGQAYVLCGLGRVRHMTGEYAASAALQEQALSMFRDLGSRQGQANALHNLGHIRIMTGDLEAAADLYERSLSMFRDLGSLQGQANTLWGLGRVRHLSGSPEAAADLYERSLSLFESVGDRQGVAELLISMGELTAETTGPSEALLLHRQALRLARQIQSPLDEARALEGAARCAARTGDRTAALTDQRQALALYQRIKSPEATAAAAYLAALELEDVCRSETPCRNA